MENQSNPQNQFETIKQEKEVLVQHLDQAQSKITKLEKRVKELEIEWRTETCANNLMLEEERKKQQPLQQELNHYKNQTQVGDRIIQQLKGELNQLRAENSQVKQELQAKDKQIQELTEQLIAMTNLIGQDLTSQVEFPPKGQF